MKFFRPVTALIVASALAGTASFARAHATSTVQDTTRRPAQDSARAADTSAKTRPTDTSETARAPERSPKKRAASAIAPTPEPVWPVDGPPLLSGSILPERRIVAFYGNPLSKRMGILGELPPEQMLAKLDREVAAWNAADPDTPVQPALHLITVVAQASPGKDGKYRARMDSSLIEKVYGWARQKNAILFLDLQIGKSRLEEERPRLANILKRPDVHLAIDPEFSMKRGGAPGTRIGTFDAADINYAVQFLADLVTDQQLPPKVLVVHRFT